MSDRNIRWAEVVEVSNDKGPHKLCTVECDGKQMDAYVGEVFGMQSVPHKGAMVLIALPDGDEGKGVIIASMPRPKDRVDKQKEGEVTLKNHDTGNKIQHDKDGHTNQSTKADLKQEIGANHTSTVTGSHSETIGNGQSIDVTGNVTYKSSGVFHINPA